MTTQPKTMAERIAELRERRAKVEAGGGQERHDKQHEQGKLTARERIEELLDPGTFEEIGLMAEHRTTMFGMDKAILPADGCITGSGAVLGRNVHIAAQDFSVAGGSAGEMHLTKMAGTCRAATLAGTPFICINDSGGARVQEGVDSLTGYGKVFYQNVNASGVIPQVTIVAGPTAGGAVYSPALTDFIIQTRAARMFITGPDVIKSVTGEIITAEALGGPEAHMSNSGVIDFIAESDEEALLICKKLLSFLPSNNSEEAPFIEGYDDVEPNEHLNTIVPDDPRKGFDVRDAIRDIVDMGDFLELKEGYAKNIVIGFGRVTGLTVGIIANQPNHLSGVLDINASDKGARFIRFCNAFNIPLLTMVDVPGFLPGSSQEYGGIIRHGAKMLFAYSAATVPKITIEMRKAYGGGYIAMCSRELGADRVFAWPTAEIAVMGAEGAANIVFRREINAADDPEAKRTELVNLYRDAFSNPYVAASRGQVDAVIEPAETRLYVARALDVLGGKREVRPAKKHGLIPL